MPIFVIKTVHEMEAKPAAAICWIEVFENFTASLVLLDILPKDV